MMLPQFENATLLTNVSILTSQFELLPVPITHVQLVDKIPVKYHDDVVGLHLQFNSSIDLIKFLNLNIDALYNFFLKCEFTDNSILCYGRK